MAEPERNNRISPSSSVESVPPCNPWYRQHIDNAREGYRLADFYLPTLLVTGIDTFDTLGRHAARYGRRALLVTGGRAARRSGWLERATALLGAEGVAVTPFDRVSGEPTLALVEEGVIDRSDLELFSFVETAEEAWVLLEPVLQAYAQKHRP